MSQEGVPTIPHNPPAPGAGHCTWLITLVTYGGLGHPGQPMRGGTTARPPPFLPSGCRPKCVSVWKAL